MIRLERYDTRPGGTLGTLILESGARYPTIELPWEFNQPKRSCIPEGRYYLKRHESPLVARITHGEFSWTWEVQDVPDRSYILIHPGNTIEDTEGCILPGMSTSTIRGLPAVLNSRRAFDEIMRALAARNEWRLDIVWRSPEFP